MSRFIDNDTMARLTCADCGVDFAITTVCYNSWTKYVKTFFCPNGHQQQFPKPDAKLEEQHQLKKELETAQTRILELETELKSYQDNPRLEIVIGNASSTKESA
jgi:hypothetical protein